jgi:hypothetical protein
VFYNPREPHECSRLFENRSLFSEGYEDCPFYGWCEHKWEVRMKELEKEYQRIWENWPFKGKIPKKEYDENYQRAKIRIMEISEDVSKLIEPERVKEDTYQKLYKEYESLCGEMASDEEYQRIFGSEEPRDVDLSKGKVSKDLVCKIRRIKDILEEKEKYEKIENSMWQEDNQIMVGGSSEIQLPNPVKTVDLSDRYSVLRAYNRGVSNEFIKKNLDILRNPMTDEELDRRMDERAREGRREDEERIKGHNEAFKRIEEFDKRYYEEKAFKFRVYKRFLGIVFSMVGALLGYSLLRDYVFKSSVDMGTSFL